ncbi:DNA cytosine methyltransferase [Enterococcus avium]|uniref:DNA cytosine methyltransferase n=1 Tax=Enterococcus avium TaxID=33945 RepID=UPI003DA2EC3D
MIKKAISLFSSIGVAEYYLKDIGIDVVLANEIDSKRVEAYKDIYPQTQVISGDITREKIREEIINRASHIDIDLIIATPPCQGVSLAGINKKSGDYRKDSRNFLVLEAIKIFEELKTDYFIIENVPRFKKMLFPVDGKYISLEQLLFQKFGKNYNIAIEELNSADFGVPQTRLRIVYRLWRKGLKWSLQKTNKITTLRDAIGSLPSLESGESSELKNHFARVHPNNHIIALQHTPTGKSAFDNEIHFPKKVNGDKVKGYNNTYKRMSWDKPAPTVTMRNEAISSQENVHPGHPLENGKWSDARVLTLRELLIVSSLPADMDIPSSLNERQFRILIGEGIPPLMMKYILKGINY